MKNYLFDYLNEPSHESLNKQIKVDFDEKLDYDSEPKLLVVEQACDIEKVDTLCSEDDNMTIDEDESEIFDDSHY